MKNQLYSDIENILIPLRDGDEAIVNVFFHPISGTITSYAQFITTLSNTNASYAIQFPTHLTLYSIEEMVSIYVDVIRKRFQESKFVLIGWSFGGVLAYEVARKLTYFGIDISHLFMIDACFLLSHYKEFAFRLEQTMEEHLLQRFFYDLLQSSGLAFSIKPDLPQIKSIEELLIWLTEEGIYPVKKSQYHYFENVFHAFKCNTIALTHYCPGAYHNNVTHIVAQSPVENIKLDKEAWKNRVSGVSSFVTVPGNHYSMMTMGQYREKMVQIMNQWLTLEKIVV